MSLKVSPSYVDCPKCGAPTGAPCITDNGVRRVFHSRRRAKLERTLDAVRETVAAMRRAAGAS